MTNCLSPSMIPGHLHSLWAHFSRQTTCTPQVFLLTPVDTSHRLKDPFYRQLSFVLPHEHSATPPELQISYFIIWNHQAGSFLLFWLQPGCRRVLLAACRPSPWDLSAQLQSNQQIFPALLTPDPAPLLPDIPCLDAAASRKAPQTFQPRWFTS